MCCKYKNKNNYVFIYCDILNTKELGPNYLTTFEDKVEDYYSNYNYCPYCGKKLEIKKSVMEVNKEYLKEE